MLYLKCQFEKMPKICCWSWDLNKLTLLRHRRHISRGRCRRSTMASHIISITDCRHRNIVTYWRATRRRDSITLVNCIVTRTRRSIIVVVFVFVTLHNMWQTFSHVWRTAGEVIVVIRSCRAATWDRVVVAVGGDGRQEVVVPEVLLGIGVSIDL